jgi:hypothetical protein
MNKPPVILIPKEGCEKTLRALLQVTEDRYLNIPEGLVPDPGLEHDLLFLRPLVKDGEVNLDDLRAHNNWRLDDLNLRLTLKKLDLYCDGKPTEDDYIKC